MKKLISIILLALPTLLLGQETNLNFNYSFHGDYNPIANDYSTNMEIDSVANIAFYINSEQTKIVVTSQEDTIFRHHIDGIEKDDEGFLIFNTTTFISKAVFMLEESKNGMTMLYYWVDQTEGVRMHYKYKYFWVNK